MSEGGDGLRQSELDKVAGGKPVFNGDPCDGSEVTGRRAP
jgi:hypothetical protein